MDLASVRNAIERYARAVQEADVDELRRITSGALRERLSPEKTQLIVADLAADTCQHGSISVSDFRDAYLDAEQWKITATVNFEQVPPLDVRFRLIEWQGEWQLVGADTLSGDAKGSMESFCEESAVPIRRVEMSDGAGVGVDREDVASAAAAT